MTAELTITKIKCPYCQTILNNVELSDWNEKGVIRHSESERQTCDGCENEVIVEAKIIVTVN